jgi:hypothetical protein
MSGYKKIDGVLVRFEVEREFWKDTF